MQLHLTAAHYQSLAEDAKQASDNRFDAIGVLLARCTTDQLSDIVHGILAGEYRDLPDAFVDTFDEAYKAVDIARAQWADRHEYYGDGSPRSAAGQVTFGMHHPDSPSFGRAC